MKTVIVFLLGGLISMGATVAAHSQAVIPASPAASAPLPALATSKPIPNRSTAFRAAENANEPGKLRPEQRVIPQITLPLARNSEVSPASPAASLSAGSVPGAVNDGAARCLATSAAKESGACERGLPASGPLTMGR